MITESHYHSEPVRVVQTRGDDFTIGVQHAEQTGEAAVKGMASFYYSFWKRMLNSGPSGKLAALAYRAGVYFVDPVLVGRLSSQLPPYALARLQGVSEKTGRPLATLTTALVLPDLLPLLEVMASRFRPGAFLEVLPPPRFGCSSFIAKGDYFLHGRNLDFPGVGYWDRYPVMQVTRRPGGLSYIGFTTAGAPICGITGVNEAQISVSLHQHYAHVASLRGQLPFIIGEEILFGARNLKQAEKILRDAKVASSWAFIVTDGKSREGFIYECHPKRGGFRRTTEETPVLAHSNYFQTPECRPAEFATTARMNWDNHCRKDRIQSLVEAAGGKLTPADAVKILSDHFDPYWGEEKIINRTVSQVFNIQSLVLDTENMKVYFAEGDAPVHLGKYREWDLGEMFAGHEGKTERVYEPYIFQSQEKRKAKQHYIYSFIAAFDGRWEEAAREVDHTLAHDFVPEAALVGGILKLKLGQLESGRELLERAKTFLEEKVARKGGEIWPPEYFEVCFFLGRAHDLLGHPKKARNLYQWVARHPGITDPNIRRLAERGKPYRAEQLNRLLMPYSSYIPFE